MKTLDDVRQALAKEGFVQTENFRVTVLGGEAQEKKTGRAFDNVIALNKGVAGKDFLVRRMEGYTFRCSADHYTLSVAGVLCRSWVHRCQFYFDLEKVDFLGQGVVFGERHHR
eukprot:7963404-Lingulodinium_polyedra.AAC.1